jgi:hypothetical protein
VKLLKKWRKKMGKGKVSKSKGNVSSGKHSTVSRVTRRAMREQYLHSGERLVNQLKALESGKDVVMTIENPNKEETNRPFIKKRISAKEWNAKRTPFFIKGDA